MAGLSIQIIAGFLLFGTAFGVRFQEIHHEMSPEERLGVFGTAGTEVPLYEVVEIQSPKLQKRSVEAGHHIKIRAFGDEIEYYLTPLNDVFATENTPNRGYNVADIMTSDIVTQNP
ncbi:uncharacterized protein LOC123265378 [Cotesia glomerata]|uniref:uncharacterized protein LOC123265378 n=1 Tax=Cotesia glomerata TaxID=32391 RepID=UPI001D01A632|nr:uncharacterized protein LOC123265378 [Cotesia glomerata]